MDNDKKIRGYITKLIVCCVFIYGCTGVMVASVWAKPEVVVDPKANEPRAITEEEYSQNVKDLMQYLEGRTNTYVYQRIDRPDPFRPFLREKFVDQEVESRGSSVLVGMQRFEPGQLQLVAVVQSNNGPIAMVQDSTGKGYMITPGLKLGRRGVIEEISAGMVLVRQQYTMTSGTVRHRIVKMMMKREGE